MRLYLVQHGEAAPEQEDPERRLTKKGVSDVQKITDFLKPLSITVTSIRHSGKARALQTAEILTGGVNAPTPLPHSGLAPNDPVQPIADEIAPLSDDLMIVGHLPFMGKLASLLVAGSESADVVAFQQGGVVCLERGPEAAWRVRWMVTPDVFP